MYRCVWHVLMSTTVRMWRAADNFQESGLPSTMRVLGIKLRPGLGSHLDDPMAARS